MASMNPFDLLGDDDNDDPSQLLAAQEHKLGPLTAKKPQAQPAAQPAKPAKLPSKPVPPAQAVREGKNEVGRGGGRGSGRGYGRGRGGGGFTRDSVNNENTFGNNNGFSGGGYRPTEEGDAGKPSERRGSGGPRGPFRGGRRGGFSNGEDAEGERPRRIYERRSGTGRGSELKREGSGRGNWGTPTDEIAPDVEEPVTENEKNVGAEKHLGSYEALPLLSLNHVSLLCRSVWDSVRFYEDVLGFVLIKRPSSFNFNGAWLYNYGIGIHLIENPALDEYDTVNELRPINPKDNHISFQCTDVGLVIRRLQDMGMRYVTAVVEDDGAKVDQVFFHDPDGYMVELCNCENIPVIPISSCAFKPRGESFKKAPAKCGFMENVMMESLSMDMMNFSF